MKKRVNFITNNSNIANYLITPVRHNRKALYERGVKVRFFHKLNKKNLECDILLLISQHVLREIGEKRAVLEESGPVVQFLSNARKYASKIVWMDITDSTGVTHFELLPHVDLYLKKHLFKNKSLYTQEFYGGRIFSDFYHRKYGIIDSKPFKQFYPLDTKFMNKVDLSWNMGMGDIYNAFSNKNGLSRRFPKLITTNYKVPFTDPKTDRQYDIFMRMNTNLARETVTFHRKELVSRLDRMLEIDKSLHGSVEGKLPLRKYRQMMKESKIGFGPFGWGELNVREYEALIFGCLLLRPDISHMDTWPNIFISGETCDTYRWDFSDLEEKIRTYLDDEKRRLEIAQNGQDAYRDSISQKGMNRFCDWFIQEIEK